jgi:hypothetical protein
MTRPRRPLGIAVVTGIVALAPAGARASRTLCVGDATGCAATIQSALSAARDGDVISIGAGTYRGPLVITKSVRLAGAGPDATTIRGGGPVVTVGEFLAAHQPTVVITGVTISGGVTTSSDESQAFIGADGVFAAGGGLKIDPAANFKRGATVTVTNSIISGNRAAPTTTMPFGPPCPDGPCPFAMARGGGIDNWGRLALERTTVSDNVVAGAASDAIGGGINTWGPGSLELHDSDVVRNRAIASVPNGRFAEGGGIYLDPGVPLEIDGGSVSRNRASLTSELPYFVPGADPIDMHASGGGIHAGDGNSVTITGTSLNGNEARVSDQNGEPYAFDAALKPGGGPLRLSDVVIDGNAVVADVGSSEHAGPSGSALDVTGQATLTRVRVTHNTTVVRSDNGFADANGAVYAGDPDGALIEQSAIADNDVRAAGVSGRARVRGAGLINDGVLTVRSTAITSNSGSASAPAGAAEGGGIWNGSMFNPPPIRLTLRDTKVTHNTLGGSPGIAIAGGGLWTAFPVKSFDSLISGNAPDNCSGC